MGTSTVVYLLHLDPKNTAEALDSEGWLHSGDIGELDSQGRFKVIDRIKVVSILTPCKTL